MDALTGRLPDDWQQLPLGEICQLVTGMSPPPNDDPDADVIPLLAPRHIVHRRASLHPDSSVPRDAPLAALHDPLMPGDILVTRTGTVGRCALITPAQEGWLFNTQLVRIRAADPSHPPYLVHYLSLPSTQDWIRRHATQTATVPSLTLRALRRLPVTLPPPPIRRGIADALGALDEKIRVHEEISRTTAELREVMAELLMTGEMPIPGALREF